MIGTLHKKNLANTKRRKEAATLQNISTSECISREESYRIPPELIRDLFIEIISNDM